MLEKLKDIKECPHCGCREIKSMEVRNKHTNGHWNEDVKFGCGYHAHFSPNYMKVLEEGECEKSKPYKERMEKRQTFLDKLNNYVRKADIDDKFRERVNSNIQYIRP
jgi:hypothetical protein